MTCTSTRLSPDYLRPSWSCPRLWPRRGSAYLLLLLLVLPPLGSLNTSKPLSLPLTLLLHAPAQYQCTHRTRQTRSQSTAKSPMPSTRGGCCVQKQTYHQGAMCSSANLFSLFISLASDLTPVDCSTRTIVIVSPLINSLSSCMYWELCEGRTLGHALYTRTEESDYKS